MKETDMNIDNSI